MKRRTFLRSAAAATGPWIIGCGDSASKQAQPNIMIAIADDLSWNDAGCYGSTEVSTPNIDRLAQEGMRFTRAFTGTAMCAPMRQQMYTGLFPVRNGAYPNHSQIKPGVRTWPSYFQELGYRVGIAGKRHFGPLESYPFEYLTDGKAISFEAVEEFVNRDPSQPYCVFVTSNEPHGPHDKGDPSLHPPARLEMPPYWVDTPELRETLSRYYAECEYFDGELERCDKIIERGGQRENTFFLSCSEQGSGFPFGKWTCYDRGLRQADIVRWPARIKAGSVANAMVQGVDWLPTLLEAAGGTPPEDIDGKSFLPVLEGRGDRHATEVYGVHTTRGIILGSQCYPVRSIRTETHKLILNPNHETKFQNVVTDRNADGYWGSWVEKAKTDPEAARLVERYQWRPRIEFYDVVEDPYEQRNLAGMDEHQAEIASMEERLATWMKSQGDLGNETEMLVKAHRTGIE